MTTTTLSSIRQSLSENIGDFLSFTTTAGGDSQGFTIISTDLLNKYGGLDDGYFGDWYALINDTDSSADGEERLVATYTPDLDNPSLRVQSAFSSQIASGITVELHRYSPTDKGNLIRRAIQELHRDLAKSIRDETLIVDNLLSNHDFEVYSSGFTGWTAVGSPTVTQETSRVFHLDSSAKVVAGASAVGQLTQAPSINMAEMAGETATVKFWCWTDAASQARININFGSETKNGDYHAGDSEWELLSVSQAIPTDATQVQVELEVTVNDTAYWDLGWLAAGSVFEYSLPTAIVGLPYRITQQYDANDIDGPYYAIPPNGNLITGRILRVQGTGLLSQPTTNSGTVEVVEPQVRLIVAYAEMLLWHLMAAPTRSAKQDRQGYVEAARDAAITVAMLKAQKGMLTPKTGAQRHRESWHVESTGSGSLIIFPKLRAGVTAL